MDLVPQTELEAVNAMLISIGQAPVNTLEVSGINDVNTARTILHNTNRSVQAQGWSFNTEERYPFTADVDGFIAIPANVLKIDPTDRTIDLVQRDDDGTMKLYDRYNHTFDLSANSVLNTDGAVECDVTWFFAFDTLPEYARNYIAVKAARRFQSQVVGSTILHQYTIEDETDALVEMRHGQADDADVNLLEDGTFHNSIFNRLYNP